MKKVVITGLLTGIVLVGGCARHTETPVATNFPYDTQKKLQAASHWQLIAKDTARQMVAAMPTRRPLYVRQPEQQSPFEKAFSQQLIASLTAAGYPVMKSDARSDTLTVEVSAEPLRFSRNRLQYKTTGGLTALAGGLWVLRNIYENVSPGAAMVTAAVAADSAHWLRSEFASGPTPRTEIVVTASVSSADRYYMQSTSAYYTSDADFSLYENWPTSALPVKGAVQ